MAQEFEIETSNLVAINGMPASGWSIDHGDLSLGVINAGFAWATSGFALEGAKAYIESKLSNNARAT